VIDIPSISAIVAAVGVIVGVILTVLELRNLMVKERQSWSRVCILQARAKDFNKIAMFFDELGILLQKGLVDVVTVEALFHEHVSRMWEKLKPIIEETRKDRNMPRAAQGFEYLYNEMKKREQQVGVKSG
jgi:hypothetical protein